MTVSEETSEIKYFDVDRLPPLITDHAQRIRDAFQGGSEAVIG